MKIVKTNTEKEKTADFDKVSDNFKKICTDNGIDQDALTTFVVNSIQLVPENEKLMFIRYLLYEIIVLGTFDVYEALGMLETVKMDYFIGALPCQTGEEE
jgi:hypothetical protein